jgi:short-chain fatty acids transporter
MGIKLSQSYLKWVQKLLPSPFSIAVILTVITSLLALLLTEPNGSEPHLVQLFFNWEQGVWSLLAFTMQMMLMLVLGHSLALSKPVLKIIDGVTSFCSSNIKSAVLVTLVSVCMGYFNWGLGLIFGAILARKVAEHGKKHAININYPLIGACGYTALMVWHGGMSGSAPLTIAKAGHSLESIIGVIPISETIFSGMNIAVFFGILLVLPLTAYLLAKNTNYEMVDVSIGYKQSELTESTTGAERMDQVAWPGILFGLLILVVCVLRFVDTENKFTYLNLDTVNLILFGLALSFHGSIKKFISSIENGMKDAAGILIQFPLYAGIMGIMNYSGLLVVFADFFIALSSPQSFPFFAYLSSGIVNILVPSGGGQWQVQGPILIEAATQMGYPINKTVMALAYGDQLTNMLQPFWALPLLGITGLKAKHILPYSILFMLAGGTVYLLALLFL